MSGIHIVAIISPAPGKEARLKELLIDLGNKVKANEKDVHKYEIFEQYNGKSGNAFVVEEYYEDESAHKAHSATEYFQALGKTIGDESLLAAPLDVKTIRPIGGFASR